MWMTFFDISYATAEHIHTLVQLESLAGELVYSLITFTKEHSLNILSAFMGALASPLGSDWNPVFHLLTPILTNNK
jgi:hypothetical protein